MLLFRRCAFCNS